MLSRASNQLIRAPVELYNPDGKDHSLQCDPQFKILHDYNARIEKDKWGIWDINIDSTALPKEPELRRKIDIATDCWVFTHRDAYLMNMLSEAEYKKYINLYGLYSNWHKDTVKRDEEYKRKKEEEQKKNSTSNVTNRPQRNDDSSYSKDEFDRLQVISEYGW